MIAQWNVHAMHEILILCRKLHIVFIGPLMTLETTREEAWRHRGSMFWREQAGHTYLIKLSPDARQTSLGPESQDTRLRYERFMARKKVVEDSGGAHG